MPDPVLVATARAIIQLLIEVLAGHRPTHQLAWRASLEVRGDLAEQWPPARTDRTDRAGRRVVLPRIIRFWVQEPVPGHAEAGAVAMVADRVHAVAVRLERHRGQWRCTAVETTLRPD